MKTILTVLGATLFSFAALAAAPSQELAQVTRALVNSPGIVDQLKANVTDNLTDVKVTQIKQGVFQYDLVFMRLCECIPGTASVTIVEDLTPTYSDGPAKYTSSINIKNGLLK